MDFDLMTGISRLNYAFETRKLTTLAIWRIRIQHRTT